MQHVSDRCGEVPPQDCTPKEKEERLRTKQQGTAPNGCRMQPSSESN